MSASEASIAEQRSSRFGIRLLMFVKRNESLFVTGNFGPLPLAQCYLAAGETEALGDLCAIPEVSADGLKAPEISRTQSSEGL